MLDWQNLTNSLQDLLGQEIVFGDIRAVLMVSIPVSILHYWFSKHVKHWLIVDLGFHKWLIR